VGEESAADSLLSDPRFQGAPITREVTTEQYDFIRRAWLTHVSAEERLFHPYTEDVWREQLKTMLSVFSTDCVMEHVPTGSAWKGRDGAEAFYREFISAFENMQWIPQSVVVGPQGVLDVVNMSGRLVRPFAELDGVGSEVALQWVIGFPWLPAEAAFRGETIYSIRPLSAAERGAG
jgi:hypothetical protein